MIDQSETRVYKTINNEIIDLYWNIGRMIVDWQDGNKKAKYGEYLLEAISDKLTNSFGKGFSIQNLRRMRQLYYAFPIRSTLSSELSISHYFELIKIKEEQKRNFICMSVLILIGMFENFKGNVQLYSMRELQYQKINQRF